MSEWKNAVSEGLDRMDRSYWFRGNAKRLQAAEETLDRLDELGPAPAMLRSMASRVEDEEARVAMLRAGLSWLSQHGATVARAACPPLASLALAALEPVQNRDGAARAALDAMPAGDPLANAVKGAPAEPALRVLSRDQPGEAPLLARQAAGSWLSPLPPDARLRAQKVLLQRLAAEMAPAAYLAGLAELPGVTAPMVTRGLASLSNGGGDLQVAAATLGEAGPKVWAAAQTLPALPAGWAGWVSRLQASCADDADRGAVLSLATRQAAAGVACDLAGQSVPGEYSEALSAGLFAELVRSAGGKLDPLAALGTRL
ncbi:MAG: hypothetical protein AB1758_07605, partial [Candidatus Eremiobacterota bacterium]